MTTTFSRREFLARGAGLVGGIGAFSMLSPAARTALSMVAPATSSLRDIEHFVIFCQENRSFDHYFGTLSGVRGFDDPAVVPDPVTGRTVFEQVDPNLLDRAGGILRPWHLDPSRTAAQCIADVDHSWQGQHVSYAGGTNTLFVTAHSVADLVNAPDPTQGGIRTMSYFTRADLPFHYGLADAFTVCDRYFCSVLGPTIPNRLYMLSAWLDPDGTQGGPEVNNLKYPSAPFRWTTYPERLQAAGVDWYVYRERDDYQDNVCDYFVQYADPKTELYRRGRSVIPPGKLADKLRADVVSGNLPQVSWIVGPEYASEHPHQLPADGAFYIQRILEALTADASVWAKTALIITYDENGGFFDHVVPPVPPPGTPGEYLTPSGLAAAPEAAGYSGPIGLGFRVPTLVISPFSRGGKVCGDTFDHTSTLRLLETRFGVEIPNLTAWRRATCGDLTSAFSFGCGVDLTVPELPDAAALLKEAKLQCASLPVATLPPDRPTPHQEPGTRHRAGPCAPSAAASGTNAVGAGNDARNTPVLAATGRRSRLTTVAAVAGAALVLRGAARERQIEPTDHR